MNKHTNAIGLVWILPNPCPDYTIVWLPEHHYKYTGTGLEKLTSYNKDIDIKNYFTRGQTSIKVITNNLQLVKILLLGVPEYLKYVLSPQFEIDASHPMSEVPQKWT